MTELNKIHTTNNYNFLMINGNREIKSLKIKNLSESIKKYGLINPININVQNQIIDGQHRYLSCKALNEPIKYIISNISNKEIVSLIRDINSVQTNWNNKDIGYAYSINTSNKESYKKYLDLVNMGVSHSTVLEACAALGKGFDKPKS